MLSATFSFYTISCIIMYELTPTACLISLIIAMMWSSTAVISMSLFRLLRALVMASFLFCIIWSQSDIPALEGDGERYRREGEWEERRCTVKNRPNQRKLCRQLSHSAVTGLKSGALNTELLLTKRWSSKPILSSYSQYNMVIACTLATIV